MEFPVAGVRVLDVGCGQAKAPGAIGVDLSPAADADVRADVGRDGLPFRSDCFDRVVLQHILEHVESPVRLLEEIHRVRVERAKELLTDTHLPVTIVAAQSGFPSVRRLDVVFTKLTGLSPTAYRRQSQAR